MKKTFLSFNSRPVSAGRGVLILLFSSVLLTACGGEEFQDLKNFVKESGADLRGQVEASPEIKVYDPFPYDNRTALPDPFQVRKPEVLKFQGSGGNQPDFARPKQDLEELSLDSLKMVGFLRRGTEAQAVIRSTEGKLHQVTVGNYMGLNFGRIISITESEIHLRETVQDSDGAWTDRSISLQMTE